MEGTDPNSLTRRKPPGARPTGRRSCSAFGLRGLRLPWFAPLALTSGVRCAPRSLRSLRCLLRPGGPDRPAPFIPTRLRVGGRRARMSTLVTGRRRPRPWRLPRELTRVSDGRRARRPLARGRSRLPDAPASSAVSVAPRRAFAFQPRGHLRTRATPRRGCSATPSPGHDSLRAGPRTDLKLASPPSRGRHCATCVCTRSE
jgi:hypothetical protein